MFFRHVEIFVSDPLKSKAFYEQVLGFEVTSVQGNGKYIWLKLEDREILLRPRNGEATPRDFQSSPFNMVLCDADPVGTLKRLKSRGLEVRGEDAGCPTFSDPDGNWFQLIGLDGSFPRAIFS